MVLVLAVTLRLFVVLAARDLALGLDDMFQYDMLARSLVAGNGFRWYAPADAAQLAPYLGVDVDALGLDPRGILTTFRAPMYPAFLALVYSLFGTGPGRLFPARLIQVCLGAILAPMTFYAGLRLLQGPRWSSEASLRASRIAALAVAVYPGLLAFPLALATENLFVPLVLAAFLALLALIPLPGNAHGTAPPTARESALAIGAGILLGLAALTRSVILPFCALGLLWLWRTKKQPRLTMLCALCMISTITPWIYRNTVVSGHLTGIETSMGYNLYLGYHPDSTGTFTFGPSLDLLSILDDREREQAGIAGALEFIREDPGRFPYLALRRLGHFFDLEWRAVTYFYSNGLVGHIPLLGLVIILLLFSIPFMWMAASAALGVATLSSGPSTSLLALLVGAYLLPHVLILSEERFHLLLIPYMAVLAAAAWTAGVRELTRQPSIWTALTAVGMLLANWSAQLVRFWPTLAAFLGPGGHRLYLPY
jgi:hypothetical protein